MSSAGSRMVTRTRSQARRAELSSGLLRGHEPAQVLTIGL